MSACIALLLCLSGVVPLNGQEVSQLALPDVPEAGLILGLEESASRLIPVAGDRKLLIRYSTSAKLAVFDVTKLKITGLIPLPEGDTLVAGGRDCAVIVSRSTGAFEKWSLDSLSLVKKGTLDVDLPLISVGLGPDSIGPLVVVERADQKYKPFSNLRILSLETFKPIVRKLVNSSQKRRKWGPFTGVTVSDDGRTGLLSGRPYPVALRLFGNVAFAIEHRGGHATQIGPGGQLSYNGVAYFLGEAHLAHDPRTILTPTRLPYCFVADKDGGVYMAGDERPFVSLRSRGFDSIPDRTQALNRIQVIPSLKVAIVLHDQILEVRTLDVARLSSQIKDPYFRITNCPPIEVRAGSTFEYIPVVESNRTDLSWVLERAPNRMSVSDTGQFTWPVPERFKDTTVSVSFRVKDGAKVVWSQSFLVSCPGEPSEYEVLALHNPVSNEPPPKPRKSSPPTSFPSPTPITRPPTRPTDWYFVLMVAVVVAVVCIVPALYWYVRKNSQRLGRHTKRIAGDHQARRRIGLSMQLFGGLILFGVLIGITSVTSKFDSAEEAARQADNQRRAVGMGYSASRHPGHVADARSRASLQQFAAEEQLEGEGELLVKTAEWIYLAAGVGVILVVMGTVLRQRSTKLNKERLTRRNIRRRKRN